MTPAKSKALAALHAGRRGKPVNPEPPKAWAALRKRLRKRNGVVTSAEDGLSIKTAAEEIGVSDRTIRRWLAGEDRPSAQYHESIERLAQ